MKKRKFNILLNIAVLCMCICAIAIGVYSAKTASLNVSGTIGFTAHNCKVRVLGKITGAVDKDNVAITSNTSTATINYTDPNDPSKGKLIDGTAETWNFGNIYFDDLNTDKDHEVNDIVFTFTITNESAFDVGVTVNKNCINDNRIFMDAPNNVETLAPQGQVTLTVKLQLQKVNGEYSNLDSAINATLLNFTKSQAPSYLATNWTEQINASNTSAFSSAKKISFVNVLDESIKSDTNYKQIKVGAEDELGNQTDLTNNTSVTDVIAYYNSTSKEIIICSPAIIYAPENCASMFSSCRDLTSLDLSNFNTSKVTEMFSMFDGCSALTSLDVSNFDTSNVTNMRGMFAGCSGLTSLDLSNFNTSEVTDMNMMFSGCNGLTSLDLSNFNTSKVRDMSYMFETCMTLTSLDLSNFNTSKVTDMSSMFSDCMELVTIYVNSSKWSTVNVTRYDNMFRYCTKLVGGAGTIYNSSKTDKTYARVDGGTANPGYLTAKA